LVSVAAPATSVAQISTRPGIASPLPAASRGQAHDNGYREGQVRGERDARNGREVAFERDSVYRSGDQGYDRVFGTRDDYRIEFRRGFAAGYRAGYERTRAAIPDRRDDHPDRQHDRERREDGRDERPDRLERRLPRGYQDSAAARGFTDGYERGLDDGRGRDRYDPIRHKDYREGDVGYRNEYGSRDAYRNNYRAGFRQGYEEGYRDGSRRR
jgi:hypothetical protein